MPSDAKIISAEGKIVAPGLLDMHCHLREPGQEYKEDIETGSLAAAYGGFSGVACMPNTRPVTDNKVVVSYIVNRAKEVNLCKVRPIGAITEGQEGKNLAAIGAMKREMNNAKWTWFAIGYQCCFAYAISLIVYQLGCLFTGHGNVLGIIVAVLLIGFICYMLFRPYKEAEHLSTKAKALAQK